MITGFNTDVKHNTKVYHVQTEDKGRSNPKIETLVYVGGEILDNYRTSYEERTQLSEEEITDLMERQHKRVIRSIKVGKYDADAPFDEELITNRDLDDVIIGYLESEESTEHLMLETKGLEELFRDRNARLLIEAKKGGSGEPIGGVHVRLKLTAPNHKSVVLAQGATKQDGTLAVKAKLPKMKVSDAALIIQAISEWGAAEQKHPIQ